VRTALNPMWLHLCGRQFRIRHRLWPHRPSASGFRTSALLPHSADGVRMVCGCQWPPQAGHIECGCGCGSADADCGRRTRWSPSII